MNKKSWLIIGSTLVIVALIIIFSNQSPKTVKYDETASTQAISPNVSAENGKQIIEISAKGGYTPRQTVAKANVPTIIRVKTNNTFDCSSALRIPAINYSKSLPATGITDIEISEQMASGSLNALCSMGMYNFTINFKS